MGNKPNAIKHCNTVCIPLSLFPQWRFNPNMIGSLIDWSCWVKGWSRWHLIDEEIKHWNLKWWRIKDATDVMQNRASGLFRGLHHSNDFLYRASNRYWDVVFRISDILCHKTLSWLSSSGAELMPVHEENPLVCWCPLQLQYCDVVGKDGAEQGSGDIKSLLRASGWPVSSQIDTINPNLALILKDIMRKDTGIISLETWGKPTVHRK